MVVVVSGISGIGISIGISIVILLIISSSSSISSNSSSSIRIVGNVIISSISSDSKRYEQSFSRTRSLTLCA